MQPNWGMPSNLPPSSAFQPISLEVGGGSEELPPKGRHLASSQPKVPRSKKPWSWLSFDMSKWGRLLVIWRDRSKKKFLLCVNFRISNMPTETQHAQFLSILCSRITMHFETLHNCSTFSSLKTELPTYFESRLFSSHSLNEVWLWIKWENSCFSYTELK